MGERRVGPGLPAALAASAALTLVAPALSAEETAARIVPPDDRAVLSLNVDNDLFGGTDKYFTAGFILSYRSPTNLPGGWLGDFADRLDPLVDDDPSRRWGLAFAQKIFTPEDIDVSNPDPDDRPYAGWLYAAASLSSYTDTLYNAVEVQLGVVGPAAQGEEVQNNFHNLINIDTARGWDFQLGNEPGLNLVASRLWRFNRPLDDDRPRGLAFGIVPNVQASVGNVQTYGGAGFMLRFGRDLYADFGPPRQRPAVSGSAAVQPAPDQWGWYVFAGVDGRLVGRDIFLDGNTFQDSRSVDKKRFVGDGSLGAALLFPWGRLAYVHTFRSEEFDGQGPFAEFGSVSLAVRF
jgi:hypothetical protein